jgi:glycerophosphoryl diester phosphodiesterase
MVRQKSAAIDRGLEERLMLAAEANPIWESLHLEVHCPPYRVLKMAHRGGVVSGSMPEGSLSSARAAIERGYDLLELDVRESADGEPVLHHDRDFGRSCGDERLVNALTVAEMRRLRFRGTAESPGTFEEVLALCRGRVGLMLEFKDERYTEGCLARVRRLIEEGGFARGTITFSNNARPQVAAALGDLVWFRIRLHRLAEWVAAGCSAPRRFAFELPADLTPAAIARFHELNVPIVAAVNTFRYPGPDHLERARADIERLKGVVDGFQMDSVYQEFVFADGSDELSRT